MENHSRTLPPSWFSRSVKKKPKGAGRKKIDMKKIDDKSSRKVAFSKRRKGMFKKGAELCKLCDVLEIAIIVFSPRGRLYSFGYPSLDSVIKKFLVENDDGIDSSFSRGCVTELEKSSSEIQEDDNVEEGFWWEETIKDLNLEELEGYKNCLEVFRYNIAMKIEEMVIRKMCERDFFG